MTTSFMSSPRFLFTSESVSKVGRNQLRVPLWWPPWRYIAW